MAFVTPKMSLKIANSPLDVYNHKHIADNFLKADVHDHSSGQGVPIGGEGIADGAITQAHIQPGALNDITLSDGSVTNFSLADGSVTEPKLSILSVSTDKILDGSVSRNKIAPGSIQLATIGDLDLIKPTGGALPGTEALRALGTTGNTAAAGNDPRFNSPRVPPDGTVTLAKLDPAVIAQFLKLNNPLNRAMVYGSGTATYLNAQHLRGTVTHNLGLTPALAVAILKTPTDTETAFVSGGTATSTTFTVDVGRINSGRVLQFWAAGSTYQFYWMAIA